ncbi:MAG: SMP-30/gluconolactonase/LRE family protein [Halioglobus sp.]
MRTCALFIPFLLAVTAACSDSNNNDSSPPPPPLLDSYQLSSSDSVPEGVAYDPKARSFYATSLQGGGIVRIDASGQEFVFRPADNRARLVGTKVDAQRRRLWVCAQQVDDLDNRVWVFDLASGNLDLEFLLGALTTNGSCNDLALDSSGAAYVTDPANPYVYRLDPATGSGAILVSDPRLADVTGAGLGLNGIALSADESVLIVGKYVPATLFRVDLPNADTLETIALSGDTLPAPDGLAVLNDDLFAVSADSVSRIRFNGNFSAASVVNVPQKSGLSTATVADSQLYVIKSDVVNFVLQQPLDTPFEIFRVDTGAFDR